MIETSKVYSLVRHTPDSDASGERCIATETPISISYNGVAYAVMMATPADLEDYAYGFSLAEGLIESPTDISDISYHSIEQGLLLNIDLLPHRHAFVLERVRRLVGQSGCGICGLESLGQALRPLQPIQTCLKINTAAIFESLASLAYHQSLNTLTGAVHAAALCQIDGTIQTVREDVGRHNALDKLIGHSLREQTSLADGYILTTSRCSYEIVEKTVQARCPVLVTVSLPTTLAIERAKAASLTLVVLARADAILLVNNPFGSIVALPNLK